MKIGSFTDPLRYFSTVHEKADSGNSGQGSQQEHRRNPKDQEPNSSLQNVSEEQVGSAVEAFRNDSLALSNGLRAEMDGNGPGLRVTLKDGSGAVVRQFTGAEFIQMREAAKHGPARGKILDQKV